MQRSNREPAGITVYGLKTNVVGPDGPESFEEPVYLDASDINAGIGNGTYERGMLRGKDCSPPSEEWPDFWQILVWAPLEWTGPAPWEH